MLIPLCTFSISVSLQYCIQLLLIMSQ